MTLKNRQDTAEQQEMTELELTGWGTLGDTLAQFEGCAINVFGGLPGERVIAHVLRYRRRRQDHVSGIVTRVLSPSPHRVDAPCGYFGLCTGCQWQHISYDYQLELKRNRVMDSIAQYPQLEGVDVGPTMPSPQLMNYRNHARFTVRNHGEMGFVNRLSRRFVKVDRCMIMAPWINEALRSLQGKTSETTQLSIRYGVNTGDWLIQPQMQNPEIPLATGQTHYTERLMGHDLRVASPSFAQVNTPQTEQMMLLVRERLHLTRRELLVDAYAGVGTFAVLLSSSVRKVIAIEESAAAVKDAAVNTDGIENLDFIKGKTEEVLKELGETPDAVILDPPRVGCHPDTLAALSQHPARRIAYISCDPDTLARDLAILVDGGYVVESMEPIDMFPQTHHVECLTVLRHGVEGRP
ncbi:MAG: class I SAM-dependent RNA methyltransferase [Chloroflexi bacterium]|nr:class I SAM-dependent RNA methyltransferase [Chloroflexota bacterium]